jgi:hypothetical protein
MITLAENARKKVRAAALSLDVPGFFVHNGFLIQKFVLKEQKRCRVDESGNAKR